MAKDATPAQPAPEQPAPQQHLFRVYSTKPGRVVLRREACSCDVGKDHSDYERPS